MIFDYPRFTLLWIVIILSNPETACCEVHSFILLAIICAQVKKDYEIVEEELKGRVKEYEALCKALELLPNYETTISKMEELIGVSKKR